MDAYEKLEKVGEGTYGKVYKAKDRNTGALVALKKTRLEVQLHTESSTDQTNLNAAQSLDERGSFAQMETEGVPSTALREISLLQVLSESNHIVKCADTGGSAEKHCLHVKFWALLRSNSFAGYCVLSTSLKTTSLYSTW